MTKKWNQSTALGNFFYSLYMKFPQLRQVWVESYDTKLKNNTFCGKSLTIVNQLLAPLEIRNLKISRGGATSRRGANHGLRLIVRFCFYIPSTASLAVQNTRNNVLKRLRHLLYHKTVIKLLFLDKFYFLDQNFW